MERPGHLNQVAKALISEAMENVALSLAMDLGYESISSEVAEDWCPTDDDIRRAAREPVSLAAAMDDLAKWLGMETPKLVADALSAPPIKTLHCVPPHGEPAARRVPLNTSEPKALRVPKSASEPYVQIAP